MEKTTTWNECLVELLKENNKPLQRKDLFFLINEHVQPITKSMAGVIIANAVKVKIIAMIKYDNIPPYYCCPDWVENGKLKPGYTFTPKWNNFKQPTI